MYWNWGCGLLGHNMNLFGALKSSKTIRPLVAALIFHQIFEGNTHVLSKFHLVGLKHESETYVFVQKLKLVS